METMQVFFFLYKNLHKKFTVFLLFFLTKEKAGGTLYADVSTRE